jgi:hypothetical protein
MWAAHSVESLANSVNVSKLFKNEREKARSKNEAIDP